MMNHDSFWGPNIAILPKIHFSISRYASSFEYFLGKIIVQVKFFGRFLVVLAWLQMIIFVL